MKCKGSPLSVMLIAPFSLDIGLIGVPCASAFASDDPSKVEKACAGRGFRLITLVGAASFPSGLESDVGSRVQFRILGIWLPCSHRWRDGLRDDDKPAVSSSDETSSLAVLKDSAADEIERALAKKGRGGNRFSGRGGVISGVGGRFCSVGVVSLDRRMAVSALDESSLTGSFASRVALGNADRGINTSSGGLGGVVDIWGRSCT